VWRVHQMMFNLWSRGTQPSEIEQMDYKTLAFWNDGHELMSKAEERQANLG